MHHFYLNIGASSHIQGFHSGFNQSTDSTGKECETVSFNP